MLTIKTRLESRLKLNAWLFLEHLLALLSFAGLFCFYLVLVDLVFENLVLETSVSGLIIGIIIDIGKFIAKEIVIYFLR